ncbi:MAG: YebC/PmpR family DNA-binding transcriptional regulator [Candidatus Dormibacteria bacterium]
MSGHSKWAGIKHKKALVDAKRGQMFTKVAREITIAARNGGGDPNANFRLRLAVQKAREVNMPADNIDRAIQRGTGGKDGANLEEHRYEGYGPHGVAVLIDVMTDNRNRTVAQIRSIFTKAGGSLGETNSVAWMFRQSGIIRVAGDGIAEERALELLDEINVGEEGDISVEDGSVVITLDPQQWDDARKQLEEKRFLVEEAEVTMVPTTTLPVDAKQAPTVIKFLEALDDLDDVQQVYANAEIPDDVLESVG